MKSEEVEIRFSSRFTLRKMNEAMRSSFVKALTEPITNSDVSYTRLENAARNSGDQDYLDQVKSIRIYVTRKSKTFDVVDFAEGMSYDEMKSLFSVYGDEKLTHFEGSRSLFGKGLTDVLLSQQYGGVVQSIQDGYYAKATFKRQRRGKRKEERLMVKFEGPVRATRELRDRCRIPSDNGTHVSFRFKTGSFPQDATLIERLSNFYILRLINSNRRRRVEIIFLTAQGRQESDVEVLGYTDPRGVLIDTLEKEFKFEKWTLALKGSLYRAEYPLPQKDVGLERRIGGLLVVDENDNSMDLTLFDYDDDPYAAKLFGSLRVKGANKLIRDKLHVYDEVLSDTRDGLRRQHEFYGVLSSQVKAWIRKHVQDERKAQAREKPGLSLDDIERQKKAFELLNQIYKDVHEEIFGQETGEELGDVKPENGLQFDREHARIEVKRRTHVGLLVDTEVIPAGSRIALRSQDPRITVSPTFLPVPEPSPETTVVRGSVYIQGDTVGARSVVLAKHDEIQANLDVEVVKKQQFEPYLPMEFHPTLARAKPNRWGSLSLYVDATVIPVGSLIQFGVSTDDVMIRPTSYALSSGDVQARDVAKVILQFRGTGEDHEARITAATGDHVAYAHVVISSRPPPGVSIFKDWQFEEIEGWSDQVYFEQNEGIIKINLGHPVNQLVFGTDAEEATIALASNLPGYLYLAELVLSECLYFTYSKAYGTGKVEQRLGDAPWLDVRNYIASKKKDLGRAFFEEFIPPQLLGELTELVTEAMLEAV